MTHGLPRWFRLLFAGVMLLLCAVMVTQLIHQRDTLTLIDSLEGKIETAQKRLAKQQVEYDEYTADLPLVLAELEETAPLAEAASARAAALKLERNALREENAALAAQIADLQAQLDALPAPEGIAQKMDDVCSDLTDVSDALQN